MFSLDLPRVYELNEPIDATGDDPYEVLARFTNY
jgi:hypothetical protein